MAGGDMLDAATADWNHVFIASRYRATCAACRAPSVLDADVNVGNHIHTVSKPEMYLRVIGTRINGTVERDTTEVIQTLSYICALVKRVVEGEETVYIPTRDAGFATYVTPVIGAVELLLTADFKWDPDHSGLYFFTPPPPAEGEAPRSRWTSRRAAACYRLIREELQALAEGRRRHTASVFAEVDAYTEEYHALVDLYQRGDSYPTFNDAVAWMRVRDFFAAAGSIVRDVHVAEQFLSYAENAVRYIERVLSYLELYNHSDAYRPTSGNVFGNCRLSEDLQMARYLQSNRSSLQGSTSPTDDAHGAPQRQRQREREDFATAVAEALPPQSPEAMRSPGLNLIRTPNPRDKREAFMLALPHSPSLFMREPRSQYAGLLNVVQNCFMNSLLQAYFTCRKFTHTVLQFPADWAERSAAGPHRQIAGPATHIDPCAGLASADGASSSAAGAGTATPQEKVIQRLQSVFSYLEKSAASCVNPEYVLEAVGAVNPSFLDGGQHDPQEFADAFIDMVCEGFKGLQRKAGAQALAEAGSDARSASSEHAQLVDDLSDLVYGETVEQSVDRATETVSAEGRVNRFLHFIPLCLPEVGQLPRGEPAGTPYQPGTPPPETRAAADTRHVLSNYVKSPAPQTPTGDAPEGDASSPLPTTPVVVGDAAATHRAPLDDRTMVSLYSALDQSAIDFHDEASSIQATLKSFRKLPKLLMFFFPGRTMEGAMQETRQLCFDRTLYLDRYVDQQSANVARDSCRRALVAHGSLQEDLKAAKACVARMRGFLNPEGDVGRVDGDGAFECRHQSALEGILAEQQERVTQLHEQLAAEEAKIGRSYAGVDRHPQNTYHLHAVIVHKKLGEHCGHYFSYALDTRSAQRRRGRAGAVRDDRPQWIKFDDTKVTTVPESEVFSEETRRNVYCLFYESRESVEEGQRLQMDVPAPLARIIEHEDQRWRGKVQRRTQHAVSAHAGGDAHTHSEDANSSRSSSRSSSSTSSDDRAYVPAPTLPRALEGYAVQDVRVPPAQPAATDGEGMILMP